MRVRKGSKLLPKVGHLPRTPVTISGARDGIVVVAHIQYAPYPVLRANTAAVIRCLPVSVRGH